MVLPGVASSPIRASSPVKLGRVSEAEAAPRLVACTRNGAAGITSGQQLAMVMVTIRWMEAQEAGLRRWQSRQQERLGLIE